MKYKEILEIIEALLTRGVIQKLCYSTGLCINLCKIRFYYVFANIKPLVKYSFGEKSIGEPSVHSYGDELSKMWSKIFGYACKKAWKGV